MEYMFIDSSRALPQKDDVQKLNSRIRSHAAKFAFRGKAKGPARFTDSGDPFRDSSPFIDARDQNARQVQKPDGNIKWRAYRVPRTNKKRTTLSIGDDQTEDNEPVSQKSQIDVKTLLPPNPKSVFHDLPESLRPSVQFMLKTFCPALYSPRYLSMGKLDGKRRKSVVPFILQDEIAFFGTLSLASAVQDVLTFDCFPMSVPRVTCERIIVRLLRRAVQKDNVPKKLLIFPIYSLTSLHWLRREDAEAELHANAIRLFANSDAFDRIDLSDPGDSSLWTVLSYQEYDKAKRAVLEMERLNPSIWGSMQYPTHPFSPETCAKLATMPPGLSMLCLTGSISSPLITALSMIASSFTSQSLLDMDTDALKADMVNRINTAICIRLLQTFRFSLAEQVLLLSLSAYCYFRAADPATWQNADGFIQVSCIRLLGRPVPELEGHNRAMLWEAMVLKTAFGHETPTREYADLMLGKLKLRDPDLYATRRELVRDFFWDPGLEDIAERVDRW